MRDKLARVADLANGGELERDLALQILREVYAGIKFGVSESVAEIVEPVAVTAVVDETVLEGEDCMVSEIEETVVKETVIEDVGEEEPAAEKSGMEGSFTIPRRVSADVIRSLYGIEPEEEPEESESELKPETEQEPEPRSESAPVPKPESEPDERPRNTLGDTIAVGHRTLGESLRKGELDMASHIAAHGGRELRRSIGLNDRFLIIRDMFDGDSAAFDAAVYRLDSFTDLDDAVIWIRDNFDRSADNKGMQLLVALIERKFGH